MSGFGIEFAAHYMLVHARVTYYIYLIDGSRSALVDPHLEVNGVVVHIHLDGIDVKEEVTLIGVQFRHGIIVLRESFVELLEVIRRAGLDTQDGVEVVVGVDGVADPVDGADVVLVALADGHIDIDSRGVFGVGGYTVGNDVGITVTKFVVLLDDGFLVVLELGGDELLGAEEVENVVVIRLFHRLVDLGMRECLVAGNVDLADLGLGFLIDIDEYLDVSFSVAIGLLEHGHIGIMETFLRQVLGHHGLGAVGKVRRHLRTFADADFYLHVLFLALFESVIDDVAHTGALLEANLQPDLVALDLLGNDLNV